MKKTYDAPVVELLEYETEDIMTLSGFVGDDNDADWPWTKDNDYGWIWG